MFTSLRATYARVGRPLRLTAAAACLLLAGVSALESSRAATPHAARGGTPVVVAARTLPAGRVLRAADLQVVRLPRAAVPDGAARAPATLVGRRLATGVTAREPVLPPRLLGSGLTRGLGPGLVAAPVSLGTDVTSLVRAGDRVDLVATPGPDADPPTGKRAEATAALVSGVRVLAVLPGTDDVPGTRLVVGVTRRDAFRIAAAGTSDVFTVVVSPP